MSQPEPKARDSAPRWSAGSLALFVSGLLILVLSGFRTAIVGIMALIEGDPSRILLILIFGGVPMAVGAALVYVGLKTPATDPTSQIPPHEQKTPRWTVASVALFVIGLLILVSSGYCTALFGLTYAFGFLGSADIAIVLSAILPVLLLGTVPMALGAALVYAGLKSRRRD